MKIAAPFHRWWTTAMTAAALLAITSTPRTASAALFQSGESNACNSNSDILNDSACQPWSTQGFDTANEVEIPCGVCVKITETIALTLPKGMNILGRLLIAPPADQQVVLTTDHVVVQGVLSIYTPYAPSTDETVRFVMTNNDGSAHYYTPFGVNANGICDANGCVAGKRGIVVGGGRLDVRGLPSDCTTWTHLKSVSGSVAPQVPAGSVFVQPNSGCSTTLLDETFDGTSFQSSWTHWYSRGHAPMYTVQSDTDPNDYHLEVRNRHVSWAGLTVDIVDEMASCIEPNQVYLMSFRIKLHSNKADGSSSNCVANNNNCPNLFLNRRNTLEDSNTYKGIRRVYNTFLSTEDEWHLVTSRIVFSEDDLAAMPYYRVSQYRTARVVQHNYELCYAVS